MSAFERSLQFAIIVVLIIGGYQFYFWAQRRRWFEARELTTRFDALISYDPRWVWVYSGLYYPMIVLAGFSVPTWSEFAWVQGRFLFLLAMQLPFFLFLPVQIPSHWRPYYRGEWEGTCSQRFMDLVWSFDKMRNSMPSMHVSMATMVDLTINEHWPIVGKVGILFPVLIAISALKTKQHYVVDVLPGALYGLLAYHVWNAIAPVIH